MFAPRVASLTVPQGPSPRRQGRYRQLRLEQTHLHADALQACLAFLEVGLIHSPLDGMAEAIEDEDGRILWFAGFRIRQQLAKSGGAAHLFVRAVGSMNADQIRAAAWRELCMLPGGLRPAQAARWYRKMETGMPKDIARLYLGSHGLTISGAARLLGVGRSSLVRHLGSDKAP